uniref:Secreted protein n=1 Tax=Trichogramma kaykai TaxID=54128 RepID=A0ABD2XIN0_9HYME
MYAAKAHRGLVLLLLLLLPLQEKTAKRTTFGRPRVVYIAREPCEYTASPASRSTLPHERTQTHVYIRTAVRSARSRSSEARHTDHLSYGRCVPNIVYTYPPTLQTRMSSTAAVAARRHTHRIDPGHFYEHDLVFFSRKFFSSRFDARTILRCTYNNNTRASRCLFGIPSRDDN